MKYSGFKTEKGSIYAFNDKGETIRCKKSIGVGQNTVREPSMCLFVPPQTMQVLEQYYLGNGHIDHSIRLGMTQMPEPKTFIQFSDDISIPERHQPVVVIINNKSKPEKAVQMCLATLEPIAGHIPVQKRYYPNGTSSTHIGHPIVEIYRDPVELARNAPAELLAALEHPPRPQAGLQTGLTSGVPAHS